MIVTEIKLGTDLHLVIEKAQGYRITATDAQGNEDLTTLGHTTAYPSDAEFSAMRATAIMLFPEHVTPQANLPAEPPVKPHAYERSTKRDPDNPWACKHCQHEPRHPVHTAPRP